jgi:hypothetical protein
MNTKVVDLATLNNFYKGYIGFFCTEFELFECQYWMSACLGQQWILSCNWFFKPFHSKFEMPFYMKVVSLIKMDNFHKGRILSVLVNFGERGKSSGRHLWTLGGPGIWPSLWPWVGPTSVFTSQKGSLGEVSEFLRGDGPGWPWFDHCWLLWLAVRVN